MNTTSTPQGQSDAFPAPLFDPFPEPRAYPSGWDLSELSASPAQSPAEETPHH